jgi:hypothetical protein
VGCVGTTTDAETFRPWSVHEGEGEGGDSVEFVHKHDRELDGDEAEHPLGLATVALLEQIVKKEGDPDEGGLRDAPMPRRKRVSWAAMLAAVAWVSARMMSLLGI